jgi:DNA-binding CsgD family transcriptional regulator
MLSPEVEDALAVCYDAIASPETWATALDELSHSLGATACQILPYDAAQHQFGILQSSHGWRMHGRWRPHSDWVRLVFEPLGDPFVRRGDRAVIQSQLFTDEEIRVSRFNQEVARPIGCLYWACGIFKVEDRAWCLPIFRGTEPFSPDVIEPIGEVAQRISRIISISEKVARTGAVNQITTLERTGLAALLIDGIGHVAGANSRMERLFCKDFCIRNGRLWTADHATLTRLDRLLAEVVNSIRGSTPMPSPVVLPRDRAAWLLIEPMPISTATREIIGGCAAVLVVSDLTECPKMDATLLCLVYGLTGAEARLAVTLCEGQDLCAAAAKFGVTRHTVRDQLKTVFAKTGARRQAELVARVAQLRTGVVH